MYVCVFVCVFVFLLIYSLFYLFIYLFIYLLTLFFSFEYILYSCGGVFQMFSNSVTGTIEGSIRGSIGRTLVSHNNNSSRRPEAVKSLGLGGGLGGMISSGLGYTTVDGDESMNSSSGNNNNYTNSHSNGNESGTLLPLRENAPKKKENSLGNKPIVTKNVVFSILPHDEDDDGEELEII